MRRKDEHAYPDRPPDVDTPYFNIWEEKGEEKLTEKGLITLEKGEEVYEVRGYHYFDPKLADYVFFIMSKKRGDEVYVAFRLKKEREPRVEGIKGWIKESSYQEFVRELEKSLLSLGFDVDNPKVMDGRKMNIYLREG